MSFLLCRRNGLDKRGVPEMIKSFWGEEEPRREQENDNTLAFSANTADDDEVTGMAK